MKPEMDDGKFWLPTEFLNDGDLVMDFKTGKPNSGMLTGNRGLYGWSSFSGFGNSDLGSPVESLMGSTETESDEEDYLNELTRKLAQSTLEDDFWKTETDKQSTKVMVGSPQSTLCGCKQVSNRGSPNCPSPLPAAAASHNESAWDLLYAAAGEVARLKMAEETGFKYYNPNGNHVPPQQLQTKPNLQYQQLLAAQLKQQQMMKQRQQQQYQQFILQSRARNGGGNMKPVAPPLSAWPTLQQSQPPGSGMRAVFLGNPNTKRECTGTGVFLPRQVGAPAEPINKRGCSTVLLPDRVVQALNLNMEAQPRSNGGRLAHDYDAEMMYRNSNLMAEQRRQEVVKDLRLPQEWTY